MATLQLSEETTLPSRRLRRRAGRPRLAAGRRRPLRRRRPAPRASSTSAPTFRRCAISARAPDPAAALRAAPGSGSARWRTSSPTRRRDRRDPDRPLAARARRSAGDQGGRRHLRDLDAGARHRGARARRAGTAPRRSATRCDAADRRRSSSAQARLAGRDAAEGGADRRGRVVAISRSRHRPGRRDFHQEPADVGGRLRRRRRLPQRARTGTTRSRRSCSRSLRAAAIVGATLGNDVNLRDFEGRSRAAARQGQGPERQLRDRPVPALLRRDVLARRRARAASISLTVEGEDGFRLEGGSSMARDQPRSRRPRRAD